MFGGDKIIAHRWFMDGDEVWCVQIGFKPWHYYLVGRDTTGALRDEYERVLDSEKPLDRSANYGFGPSQHSRSVVELMASLFVGIYETATLSAPHRLSTRG